MRQLKLVVRDECGAENLHFVVFIVVIVIVVVAVVVVIVTVVA